MTPKTLLIGWDAADWQVIDPLLEKGLMPSLQAFLKKGVRGNLATLQPALSPLLWTSIATGKHPHDHGVLGFVQPGKSPDEVIPIQSIQRRSKAFWNIFTEAGITSAVVNWWPSYPVENIQGIQISNQFCNWPEDPQNWPLPESHVHPKSFEKIVRELRMLPSELSYAHLQPFFPELSAEELSEDPLVAQAAGILAKCASVHNLITHLLESEKWDCAAVYYEALDHFSHLAMKYHPPQLPDISDEHFRKYSQVVTAAYRFHDMMLERLLSLAGPECNVIVISDHGFEAGSRRSPELPDLPAAPALEHRTLGIFAAQGPAFRQNETLYGASLLDILPTLLHLHGLPKGQDMPGRVLLETLRHRQKVSEIPSWEMTPTKTDFYPVSSEASPSVLAQLEELGYLNLPNDHRHRAATVEWDFNRALSLLNSGRAAEALPLSRALYREDPGLRASSLLADTLLRCGEMEAFESLWQEWPQAVRQHPYGLYWRGLAHLQMGETEQALEYFRQIEKRGIPSVQLFLQMGHSLFITGQLKVSREYFQKALDLEPESPAALTGMAQVLLEEGQFETLLPLLEKSLQLQFFQPPAHYAMALALRQIGEDQAAWQALEICLQQAPRHQKARKLAQQWRGSSAQQEEETIIVSGFPRSGTSMLMAILEAGGIPLIQDHKRTPDQQNPNGYFEWEPIRQLGSGEEKLPPSAGKALKVVAPLLRYLPPERPYCVLWMDRPLLEVILSQEKMKAAQNKDAPADPVQNFPFQLAMDYEAEEKRLMRWLDQQPHIRYRKFSYREFLENPQKVVKEVVEFSGCELDVTAAQAAIKPHLHRQKIG